MVFGLLSFIAQCFVHNGSQFSDWAVHCVKLGHLN
jgi:hypothetical protein